jgi:hypothetical protein
MSGQMPISTLHMRNCRCGATTVVPQSTSMALAKCMLHAYHIANLLRLRSTCASITPCMIHKHKHAKELTCASLSAAASTCPTSCGPAAFMLVPGSAVLLACCARASAARHPTFTTNAACSHRHISSQWLFQRNVALTPLCPWTGGMTWGGMCST